MAAELDSFETAVLLDDLCVKLPFDLGEDFDALGTIHRHLAVHSPKRPLNGTCMRVSSVALNGAGQYALTCKLPVPPKTANAAHNAAPLMRIAES